MDGKSNDKWIIIWKRGMKYMSIGYKNMDKSVTQHTKISLPMYGGNLYSFFNLLIWSITTYF